jgi:hypothetical protein
MNRRLGGDSSLNATAVGKDAESLEWQDWLVDEDQTARSGCSSTVEEQDNGAPC